MRVAFLGDSLASPWSGATTGYRGLVRELAARGHQVLFCERAVPPFNASRDLRETRGGRLCLYGSVDELAQSAGAQIAAADLVIIGADVPELATVAEYVLSTAGGRTAFYDPETPETLARIAAGEHQTLTASLIARFDLYLSSAGGPTLRLLEDVHGARRAIPFYPVADPRGHLSVASRPCWDLGYHGAYSPERQAGLDTLLVAPARVLRARRFVVAGPGYPETMAWPANVARIQSVARARQPVFFSALRFALNLTPAVASRSGWSPGAELFEAAACGVAIISDLWPGIEEFLTPGKEIIVARSADEVLRAIIETGAGERLALAGRARQRILREHTAARRIDQIERELRELAPMGSPLPGHGRSGRSVESAGIEP